MTRTLLLHGAVILALGGSSPVWSQPRQPFSPSAEELQLLPDECKVILEGTQAQKKAMHQQAFPGWVGPNHYCWGLNFLNRARYSSRDKIERRFNLQSAIGEFRYVLRHSPPDTVNLDQVRMNSQMAEMMLKMQR